VKTLWGVVRLGEQADTAPSAPRAGVNIFVLEELQAPFEFLIVKRPSLSIVFCPFLIFLKQGHGLSAETVPYKTAIVDEIRQGVIGSLPIFGSL